MIIELENIHVNVGYLYWRHVSYQQMRKKPLETKQVRGYTVNMQKDETHIPYNYILM